MLRIFYFNINFICNNKCIFCFSHNTYYSRKYIITEDDIQTLIQKYEINKNDRVIINGGEPTLHPSLLTVLKTLCSTEAEIILYSNGRRLSDNSFCWSVLELVNRIVIPIHGTERIHDLITGVDGSYGETKKAIDEINIISPDKLELKFIVTDKMVYSSFNINEFLSENKYEPISLFITGTVDTKVSKANNYRQPSDEAFGKYISSQLHNLFNTYSGTIKMADCKLCLLSEPIIKHIQNLPLTIEKNTNYNYFYFDGKHKEGKLIEYNSIRKCSNCMNLDICRSIVDSCKVLALTSSTKKIVLE